MATTITAGNATNGGAAVSADNTGILELKTGTGAGTTAMTVNASQNVGIGTSSPSAKLHVVGDVRLDGNVESNSSAYVYSWAGGSSGQVRSGVYLDGTNSLLAFFTGQAERARITSDGLFQFNSGYGSVATAYGCRAWVNFNGTAAGTFAGGTSTVTRVAGSTTATVTTTTAHGLITGNQVYALTGVAAGAYTITYISATSFSFTTVATTALTNASITFAVNSIRASGNVSSVADNGTGDYTVNFTTAMPDANFETNLTASDFNTSAVYSGSVSPRIPTVGALATGSVRIYTGYMTAASSLADYAYINVSVFR